MALVCCYTHSSRLPELSGVYSGAVSNVLNNHGGRAVGSWGENDNVTPAASE